MFASVFHTGTRTVYLMSTHGQLGLFRVLHSPVYPCSITCCRELYKMKMHHMKQIILDAYFCLQILPLLTEHKADDDDSKGEADHCTAPPSPF